MYYFGKMLPYIHRPLDSDLEDTQKLPSAGQEAGLLQGKQDLFHNYSVQKTAPPLSRFHRDAFFTNQAVDSLQGICANLLLQGYENLEWLSAWPLLPAKDGMLVSLTRIDLSTSIFQGHDWSQGLKDTLATLGCRQAAHQFTGKDACISMQAG